LKKNRGVNFIFEAFALLEQHWKTQSLDCYSKSPRSILQFYMLSANKTQFNVLG